LPPPPPSLSSTPSPPPRSTPFPYTPLFRSQQAVSAIASGRAAKVVLSERTTVRSTERLDPAVLLDRLARAYPSTWVYHLDDVIVASPDMLAQTDGDQVISRVLADSPSTSHDAELTEHAFAVDSVLERLECLAEDICVSPEPFVLRLPGLEHLASDVSAQLLPGATSLDVAARLHPSAAVSGTPRQEADEIIARLEPHDRSGYAAPVGWMKAHGDGQWEIALSMAQLVSDHEDQLQTGGGMVA